MTLAYIGQFLSDETVRACLPDMDHEIKYMNHGRRGKSAFLPSNEVIATSTLLSPVEAVKLGLEKPSYLDEFRHDSVWYFEIQEYKSSIASETPAGA